MKSNNLIIAAAGSGKTTYLVNKACELKNESVLITTYTETNEAAIKQAIIEKKGYIPSHIKVQTWFSFLLQHGVRPYQSVLNAGIHRKDIGFVLVSEKSGKRLNSQGKPILFRGNPMYWGEDDFEKHYFTRDFKIFSDKISKFIFKCNEASKNQVVERISRIFSHIYVDEVQDLAGYDLELLKLLFSSNSSVLLVGDPRQVTYLTHNSPKYEKYSDGLIKDFIENELGKRIKCEVDETTLNVSHRNNQLICNYSARLYPSLPIPSECTCIKCRSVQNSHKGVFLVKHQDIEKYLSAYSPIQLRWSASTKCDARFPVMNMGESKGLSFDRVLIYPTENMIEWIKDNNASMANSTRAKLYVGITRARHSVAILLNYKDSEEFEGIEKYTIDGKNA